MDENTFSPNETATPMMTTSAEVKFPLEQTLSILRHEGGERMSSTEAWTATTARMASIRDEIQLAPKEDERDMRLILEYLVLHSKSLRSTVAKTALETLNAVLAALRDVEIAGLFITPDGAQEEQEEQDAERNSLVANLVSTLTLKVSSSEKKFISDTAEACLASFIRMREARTHAGYVLNRLLLKRALVSKNVKEVAIAAKCAAAFVEAGGREAGRGVLVMSEAEASAVVANCALIREGKSVEARRYAAMIVSALVRE